MQRHARTAAEARTGLKTKPKRTQGQHNNETQAKANQKNSM